MCIPKDLTIIDIRHIEMTGMQMSEIYFSNLKSQNNVIISDYMTQNSSMTDNKNK